MTVNTLTADDHLMIRIQEGEPEAFEELVDRYQGPLYGFFYHNLRDAQFAEDLTQETLLRIFRQSWDYLPSGRFRAWMYRIGRNLMIDNLRRQSRDALVRTVRGRPEQDEQDVLARIASNLLPPEDRASQRELATIVDGMLMRLPDAQRQTFVLHHYNGLTLSEVADVLESSLPTSKSRLRLAREKLQDYLKNYGVTGHAPAGD